MRMIELPSQMIKRKLRFGLLEVAVLTALCALCAVFRLWVFTGALALGISYDLRVTWKLWRISRSPYLFLEDIRALTAALQDAPKEQE